MAAFHALMLVCSLTTADAGECTVFAGPGSPFTTREECLKTTQDGQQTVKDDNETMAALASGEIEVTFVCHEAKDGFKLEDSLGYIVQRYGPPQGDKI